MRGRPIPECTDVVAADWSSSLVPVPGDHFRQPSWMMAPPILSNFIGNEFVAPMGGQYFDAFNPSTGEVLTRVRAKQEELDLTINRSLTAKQRMWNEQYPVQRKHSHLGVLLPLLNGLRSSTRLPISSRLVLKSSRLQSPLTRASQSPLRLP